MKKMLYITDLNEYIDHSFIGPLFESYMEKYISIDIVYFTEFKSDFEKQDDHRFVIPTRYKHSVLDKLTRNNISVIDYDYVIVRNDVSILKSLLKDKIKYNFKLGYRLSFPKRRAKIQKDIANNNADIFDIIAVKFKNNNETKIINECDIFLPTSEKMHEEFFKDVNINTIVCPPGIDPYILHKNIQHNGEEKRFFYAGTLDKLREFEIVLEAFSKVSNEKWTLSISTKDPIYAEQMLKNFSNIKDSVIIHNAKTKDELLDCIAKADIGVAILPNIPIYNTSTPIKILDYYSSAVPCIMTNTAHTNRIFTDKHDAWFCNFTVEDIAKKLEYIISLSKDEVAKVGEKGQLRLLDIRNYEKIAEDLAKQLDEI